MAEHKHAHEIPIPTSNSYLSIFTVDHPNDPPKPSIYSANHYHWQMNDACVVVQEHDIYGNSTGKNTYFPWSQIRLMQEVDKTPEEAEELKEWYAQVHGMSFEEQQEMAKKAAFLEMLNENGIDPDDPTLRIQGF